MTDHTPQPKATADIAWSHSALNAYDTCPHRYLRERVTKEYKPDFNAPALKKGNDVHKALEDYVEINKPIADPAFAKYQPWADRVVAMTEQGHMARFVELEMCFDSAWGRSSWFGPNAWFRCKADVLGVNSTSRIALNVDYKTNKRYYGENGQAELNAAATLLQFPHVDTVATAFLYMEVDKVVSKTFHRTQLPNLLTPSMTKLQEIARSYQTGVWPKKRSGLCKFCVVTDCEHNPNYGKV